MAAQPRCLQRRQLAEPETLRTREETEVHLSLSFNYLIGGDSLAGKAIDTPVDAGEGGLTAYSDG
jgi:hypothetical protein